MIRSLVIERKSRLERPIMVCSNCGFLIARQSSTGQWARGKSQRQHCSACQGLFAKVIALAHGRILTLIKRGVMEPWEGKSCIDCGAPAVSYDLRNYSLPKEAVPICKSCNNIRGPGILGDRYAK